MAMNNKSKFDIIVPCYNVEHIIEKSLDSIFSQKYSKDEYSVIVIDDGSTDNTFRLLKKYDQHESITIINRKKNRGYGYSIKEGILASKAEKIFITDADGSYPIELIPEFINNFKD